MADTKKIFRFKFSSKLNEEIVSFSHIHLYDDKVTLKESFQKWCDDNRELVDKEQKFLNEHQYSSEQNVETKIFKSIKYYYIKNLLKESSDQTEGVSKKKYDRELRTNIKLSDYFVNIIYEFIVLHYQEADFKPSTSFDAFLVEYEEEVHREKRQLYSKYEGRKLTDDDISFKIKKAFKNQYFSIIKNIK